MSSKDIRKIINKFVKSLNIILALLGIKKSSFGNKGNLKDKGELSSISSKEDNIENNKDTKEIISPKIDKKGTKNMTKNFSKIIEEKREKEKKEKEKRKKKNVNNIKRNRI